MERPKDFFRRDLTNEQYHDSDTYPHFSSSDIKSIGFVAFGKNFEAQLDILKAELF